MKSYEDIAERVFKKGDEILKRRKKRTALIRKTSFIVLEMCAVFLICFSIRSTPDINIMLNNNFPDEVITEPESDGGSEDTTGSSYTVPASESNDNEMSAQVTASGSETNPDSGVSSPPPPHDSAALNTSVPDNINTAPVQTTMQTLIDPTGIEHQTTVCTVMQTENEGSIYMKKLAAFSTSAIMIASSAAPIIGNAEYKIDESRFWAGEKAMFAQMESGELDVDINGDGAVDVMDGFTLFCYTFRQNWNDLDCGSNDEIWRTEMIKLEQAVDDATRERIESIADYNGDGIVNSVDSEHLERYLIVSKKVTREHLDVTYYDPDYYDTLYDPEIYDQFEYTWHQCSYNGVYNYIKSLDMELNNLEAKYDIFAEVCDSDRSDWAIDVDFNGNGQLDIDDLYVFFVFYDNKNKNVYISDEEWERCETALLRYPCERVLLYQPDFLKYPRKGIEGADFLYYLSHYIVERIEMKPEYFTEEYYVETYGNEYDIPSHGRMDYIVQQAAARLGLTVDDDAWLKYNKDDLNELFISYCNDVENGLISAPDVNMDGVVDLNDYFTVNTYMAELIASKTSDTSILPADIWNNIEENFDINGNGTTKDIYDILAVQMYVIKYTDTSDFDAAYERYKEGIGVNSTLDTERLSYENKVKILAEIESKTVYGDVNNDGIVDIADATKILQHIGNGDKYKLSAQEAANADCYDPGSGITILDALAVQKLDAGLIESLPEIE